jgi:hypothetical protein
MAFDPESASNTASLSAVDPSDVIGILTLLPGSVLDAERGKLRRRNTPISTAPTESTVQWLLHLRMGANQQMRWSPRGAHMMLKVRTAVANGTFERDFAVAERWARRPFRRTA